MTSMGVFVHIYDIYVFLLTRHLDLGLWSPSLQNLHQPGTKWHLFFTHDAVQQVPGIKTRSGANGMGEYSLMCGKTW